MVLIATFSEIWNNDGSFSEQKVVGLISQVTSTPFIRFLQRSCCSSLARIHFTWSF